MSAPVAWSGYVNDYYDDSIKPVTVYAGDNGPYVYEGDGLRDDISDLVGFTHAYSGYSTLHRTKMDAVQKVNVVEPDYAWPS